MSLSIVHLTPLLHNQPLMSLEQVPSASTSSTLETNEPSGAEQEAQSTDQTPAITWIRVQDHAGEIQQCNLLDDENWSSWHDDMMLTFNLCEIQDYVLGQIRCPNRDTNPIGADNWHYNDTYTQQIIRIILGHNQKIHCAGATTSHEIWSNLEAIYQLHGMQTKHQLMQDLYSCQASKGDDIIKHLQKIKCIWECIMLICQNDLPMSPGQLKEFIVHTLLMLWAPLTTPYLKEKVYTDISVHALIGDCNEEYKCQKKGEERQMSTGNNIYSANALSSQNRSANRGGGKKFSGNADITCNICGCCGHKARDCWHQDKSDTDLICAICEWHGHKVKDCWFKDKKQCEYCKQFNHTKSECRRLAFDIKKKKFEAFKKGKEKMVAQALVTEKSPKIKANITKMEEETIQTVGEKTFSYDNDDLINSSNLDVNMAEMNVSADSNYDWLADSGSTLHITNNKELYHTYTSKQHIIKGIGGKQMHVEGHGDIILQAHHNTKITDLKLKDVLYVPTNKHNLFALGKWDTNGQMYQGHDGKLTLFNKERKIIAIRTKLTQNLYKFSFEVIKQEYISQSIYALSSQPAQGWEVWHKCYG